MDKDTKLQLYFDKINLEKLTPGSIITFDLYIKAQNKYVLYKNRNLTISFDDIKRLLEYSRGNIFIHKKDRKNYRDYLEANIENILKSENVPIVKKAEALYESAVNVIEDVFENPRSGPVIKRSKQMVNHTVDFILGDEEAFVNLLKIRKHDYYTYTHSVNVCTFLVSFAKTAGINDIKTLKDVGEGGLLHDLGKSMVPSEIINKPTKLTKSEWEIMKKHPEYGVKIAKETRKISEVSLAIIGQHHEKISGNGYPLGLRGEELSVFARMASIVDVYDAITTNRSYSKARTPVEAAKFLLDHKGDFDEKLIMKFIKMVTLKENNK